MTISDEFSPFSALLGGALIGLSTVLVFALNGAIAGISGMAARLLPSGAGEKPWRVGALLGLLLGAAATFALVPSTRAFGAAPALWVAVAAGVLVGFGTRLGGGCTSGHGVCGISRGLVHSIIGTVVFMAAGFATVYVVRHVVGGGGAA